MRPFATIIVLLCISLSAVDLRAQDFEDFISKYTDANGKAYMQPLADAFGANLNSGLYHSAYIKDQGFQLYLGISVMNAFIPESNKTFVGNTQGFFNPEQSATVPTIFGSSQVVAIEGDGETYYAFPGGLDVDNLPLAVPNLTVGSLLGSDLTLRWVAYDIGEEVGKVELFGWGLRHSLNRYLPLESVHLAVGYYMQQFSVGDVVDANGWLANLQASYPWRFITFYGALGYENSTLDIRYTYEGDDSTVDFDMTGNNSLRATLGLTFNLGPVKLHTDYTLANQQLLTLGLGLGFGETVKMLEE